MPMAVVKPQAPTYPRIADPQARYLDYSMFTVSQIASRLDNYPGSSNAFNPTTCKVAEMADAESLPASAQVSHKTIGRESRRKKQDACRGIDAGPAKDRAPCPI